MESHAVPQHIQSYQFRLVGDMTLKQFSELAAGLVAGLIVYSLPLYGFIKWPLVLIFTLLGVGMAFVPIEERPLETWIVAFFKAVYAPTQYIWRKTSQPPEILLETLTVQPLPSIEIIAPQGQQKLREYLKSLPPDQVSPLDSEEQTKLQAIDQLFQSVTLPQSATPLVQPPPESLEEPSLSPHPLHPTSEVPPLPTGPKTVFQSETAIPTPAAAQPTVPSFQPRAPRYRDSAKSATFSLDIPIPVTPSSPNLVVGMVLSQEGKIVDNAILEIRESGTGHPVRATKTNKIGQFSIITPLKSGSYDIVTEKEGFSFDNILFEAKGDIIPPIEIRAKAPPPVSPAPAAN